MIISNLYSTFDLGRHRLSGEKGKVETVSSQTPEETPGIHFIYSVKSLHESSQDTLQIE